MSSVFLVSYLIDHYRVGRFLPGNPGGGRPRKRPVSAAYDERMQMVLPDDVRKVLKLPAGSTWAQAIALQQARMAIGLKASSTGAAKELREGIEGKAPMRFEMTNSEKVIIEVEYAELPEESIRRAAQYLRNQERKALPPIDVEPTEPTEPTEPEQPSE